MLPSKKKLMFAHNGNIEQVEGDTNLAKSDRKKGVCGGKWEMSPPQYRLNESQN